MIEPSAFLGETYALSRFVHDPDGNVRAALLCWGIAVSALVVLRAPRQVVLACLVVAAATVGLASVIIDAAPVAAGVSVASPARPPASFRPMPPRGPANVVERNSQN